MYNSIVMTSRGERFPSLREGQEERIQAKIQKLHFEKEGLLVLSASSEQTRRTGEIIGKLVGVPLKTESRLNPILFDFKKVMEKREFINLGDKAFDVARPRFLKAFFQNQLMEAKLSVKKRIDSLLKDYSKERTTLAISHSFLMMILRAYLKGGDRVFTDYNFLHELCYPEKRPFGFLSGFEVIFKRNSKGRKIIMLK